MTDRIRPLRSRRVASSAFLGLLTVTIVAMAAIVALGDGAQAGQSGRGSVSTALGGAIPVGLLGARPIFATGSDDGVTSWNNGPQRSDVIQMTGSVSLQDGRMNTARLVARTGAGAPHAAARLCADLTKHGRSDWYLPAKDELNLVYRAKASGLLQAREETYWSSSEVVDFDVGPMFGNDAVWTQVFGRGDWLTPSGSQNYSGKANQFGVRCVRR